MKMEWKYVFNTSIDSRFLGLPMHRVMEVIKPTGYKFFSWNGEVCSLEGEFTGIKTKDLT